MRTHIISCLLMLMLVGSGAPAVALDINDHDLSSPDWRAAPADFGGHRKWVCQAPSCGGDAAVSYSQQSLNQVFTLLDYESQWKKRAKNPKGVAQAITKRGLFQRIDSYDETDGDLRHYTIIMRHREPNGAIDYMAAGYMARGFQVYELISTALTRETAESNLKLLVSEVTKRFEHL